MPLRVYGVVMQDGQGPLKLLDGVRLHTLRDLAALIEEGDYTTRDVGEPELKRHFDVVEGIFGQDTVLPTPVGTVFRSVDVLQRWMELHYVALSDALAWVENRVAARVHVGRGNDPAIERESNSDLTVIAGEVARSLRRGAVASVPLRHDEDSGTLLSSAFLVEEALWREFDDAIADERERHPGLRITVTGPWPPYDFVRLQFGS
ncbi:MAG TPA: GvpL/GvpF family gas vesicle protein [Gemmatimonadaceae bacterium]|nr:GvpL/GvpF family gas vesicle protein [Gemmatimonadaceae bacterium]